MDILAHVFYEFNFLKIGFMLLGLSAIIVGGLVNRIEHLMPPFIMQIVRYGKCAYEGKPSSKQIEVPKRWYQHFYIFAALYASFATVTAFYIYFCSGTLPSCFSAALDLLASRYRKSTATATSSFLALLLMTIQVWRRLYETSCVSIFSNGRISIFLYIVGYVHYFGAISVLMAEAPGFTNTKDLNATFRLKDITALDIYGCVLFLWACYHQFKAAVILANMRKNKKGDVVTYEHKIPHGDWFEVVSSPHLLAEVLMYFAITIILYGTHTWFYVFLWVAGNQIEEALLTHWWYQSKFKDYPKHRRAILPYIL